MMKMLILILAGSLFSLGWMPLLSLILLVLFLMSFSFKHNAEIFMVTSSLYWDTLSFSLISFSVFISILMILASISNIKAMKYSKIFSFTILILLFMLMLVFSVSNIMMFYILFEASLIPTLILILGWGNQPERNQAGIYMLLYTVMASLPMLFILLMWSQEMNSYSFYILTVSGTKSFLTPVWAMFLILAFAVKLPVYMGHLWLPKAHVEAPVAGSMVLAAILLKLGGYGIIRVSKNAHILFKTLDIYVISWALTGGMVVALICIIQSDVKCLIALSSVAHMSLVISGAMTFSSWGINSAQFIMIGHGFCSSGLFFIANMAYERLGTRSLMFIKGLQNLAPAFAMGWFLLSTSNMAAPPSLNLLGEMAGISAIFSWSTSLAAVLASSVFLSAAYSLFLFSQTNHGKSSASMNSFHSVSPLEWLVMTLHWLPLNIFILSPITIQIILSNGSLIKMLSCGLSEMLMIYSLMASMSDSKNF